MSLSDAEDHADTDVIRRACDQTLRSRRPCARREVLCAEPGRSHKCPAQVVGTVPEGASRTRNVCVYEKSDTAIVPKNVANKEGMPLAEQREGRAVLKWNSQSPAAIRTQSRGVASTGLLAVRRAAQSRKNLKFTALMHHIDIGLLRQSYLKLKRNAASGIDGVDWRAYGERLEERLSLLHKRIQLGSYRAQPSRRVYIPKADGSLRPLSILCIEDKVVQQAIVEVLQAIYESDFMGFSYGFRPGRGQHDALDALQVALYRKQVNWILDADIRKFFDSMDHEWTLRFLQHRIGDCRLLRLIRKWLKVGIVEDGRRVRQEIGAPKGRLSRQFLQTSTCITFSICGLTIGENKMLKEVLLSSAMQMTPYWVSNISRMQRDCWRPLKPASQASVLRSILGKHGCLSSVDMLKNDVREGGKVSPRLLIFSDLHTIATARGRMAGSKWNGKQ